MEEDEEDEEKIREVAEWVVVEEAGEADGKGEKDVGEPCINLHEDGGECCGSPGGWCGKWAKESQEFPPL